ncbi:Regulator of V-ATPase in vacuolar membrane protein 1 [Rhizoctonia solani]|uniref:Regulator of V-ATPase in vacuolar membrane protein 1 n=1 Tax=Rhizoctonia solani TaxID=456999 RepID=A0A0K6FSM2_9AGAM|nr:Regulator of V-ATPase in vacuolar membrane protein 1 [Rhizoctonia solani]
MSPYEPLDHLHATVPSLVNRFNPTKYSAITIHSANAVNVGDNLTQFSGTGQTDVVEAIAHPEGTILSCYGSIVSSQLLTATHATVARHILDQFQDLPDNADITLFLELSEKQINYYLVDHSSKKILWADGQEPDSFQKTTLAHKREYWIHIENFPRPRFSTPEDLLTLKEDIAKNGIDAHTPTDSPYLIGGDIHNIHAVARLWGAFLSDRLHKGWDKSDPKFNGVCVYPVRLYTGRTVKHQECGKIFERTAERQTFCPSHACNKSYNPSNVSDCYDHAYQTAIRGEEPLVDTALRVLEALGLEDFSAQLQVSLRRPPSIQYSSSKTLSGLLTRSPHPTTPTSVALKIPQLRAPVETTDDNFVTPLMEFLHEAIIWSRCKHPSIQRFDGVARCNGPLGMTSPWMARGTLVQCVNCVSLDTDLRNTAHGDLKGVNILVDYDLTPKIIYFGSVKLKGGCLDSLTYDPRSIVTWRWASPEILSRASGVTMEGDVYSFGMTLYEAITSVRVA